MRKFLENFCKKYNYYNAILYWRHYYSEFLNCNEFPELPEDAEKEQKEVYNEILYYRKTILKLENDTFRTKSVPTKCR